ncbi:MAG: PAS domain-containing protein, partial [Chitinispirillia bacterium]
TLYNYRKNMTNLVIRRVNDLETVNERLNQELQLYQSENQSLGESAAKFNMVAENPNIGIFQIDLSGKLIYTNKAFGRMFDYETDELMHIKIQTLSPARFQDDTNIKVNKFLTRDETKGELILCNRHGKEIFIYYNAWLLIENGRSFGACGFLEDISERKLEYLQLQDKEHLLHDFFNNLTAGIIYADAESRVIQDVNNTLLNLTGYTKNEIFGLNTIQAIMPEQYHIFINKKIDEVIKTGQNTEFEVSLKKKNGLLFPADVSLFILKNENIKYNYIILQIIDNTKHKQREKRLINEKKRLADYFESMIDSIIVTDIKGNNILANQSYLNLIGYPKHNLANRNSMDKLVPLDVPKLEEEFNSELYSKGYIKDKETNIKTKKGMTIPVLYSAKVLNDNTGQPVNLVGIIRDNRKRKKEQEIVKKISAQAEFTAKLLLTSAQPFVLFSKDGRCLNCNSAFCSMTGYSKSEVLKIMNIFESLTPVNWRQRETEIIQNLIMSGEPQRYIKECIRKDGTSIFIDSSLNLIPNNTNTKIYISSFMLDITKQKNKTDKIKEELKRKKQLLKQLYSMLNTDTKS